MLTPEQKKIETKRQQNYPLIMILSKQKCCDRRSFYLATIYVLCSSVLIYLWQFNELNERGRFHDRTLHGQGVLPLTGSQILGWSHARSGLIIKKSTVGERPYYGQDLLATCTSANPLLALKIY